MGQATRKQAQMVNSESTHKTTSNENYLSQNVSTNVAVLVVDLDGTLIRTDMLYESFFAAVTEGISHHWSTFLALRGGKAPLKAYLAKISKVDYSLLPYNSDVLDLIRDAKTEGRRIYLATAGDRRHADGIGAQLGLFDGIFSSDGVINLSGEAKASQLIAAFGDRGFDYVGNGDVDLAIWSHARKAYVVGNSITVVRKVEALGIPTESVGTSRPSLRIWLKAMRIHQYAKNVLVFVALLTAHDFRPIFFMKALLAFVAFSLCASSVYLLNDLVDLNADRQHPTKQTRPFASGLIPLAHGVIAIPLLLILAFFSAIVVSVPFTAVLAAYLGLTLAYSLTLKRRLIVDIVVLAMLYTVRVIAGAAALPVVPSEWLLAFSMFIFACLALVKRYVELALRIDKELPNPSNRNYRLIDLPIIGTLAAASGFNAITIFALYISSPAVKDLYRHPFFLWLICPILLYWLSRIVVLAHRRAVDDDPIVFALGDRNSRVCAVSMIAIVLLAI